MSKLKINNFDIIYEHILKNTPNPIDSIKGDLLRIPRIPDLYFKNYDFIQRQNLNTKSVDHFYYIKVKLIKLEKIKDNILFLLELNKNKFENIYIDKIRGKLDKRFLFFKKDTLEIKNQDEFNKFSKEFIKKKNLVNGLVSQEPHFYQIFEMNYDEKDKKYFLKLFKSYTKIRDDLLKFIQNNINNFDFLSGIMSYNHFFDISEFLNLKKKQKEFLQSVKINKKNITTSNSIDYSKYIYYGNKQNLSDNESIPNNKEERIDSFKDYNAIYSNDLDDNLYKKLNKTNINDSLQKINKHMDLYLSNTDNGNLYNVLQNAIITDFYVLKLIYYYKDPIEYNETINISKERRIYINKIIRDFYQYETQFLYWIEKYITNKDGSNSKKGIFERNINTTDMLSFDTFLKTIAI
jgi:hypothetical protein